MVNKMCASPFFFETNFKQRFRKAFVSKYFAGFNWFQKKCSAASLAGGEDGKALRVWTKS